MAQIAAYTFDEGSGTTAAEVTGGTSITSVPGWAAGRHDDAIAFNDETGPSISPFLTSTVYTIMFDVYVLEPAATWNLFLDGTGIGTLQARKVNATQYSLEWYPSVDPINPALNEATWHNIAIVANGSQHRLYIDGALAGTGGYNANLSGTDPVQISGRGALFPSKFRMDNLRFHNSVLSDSQITALAGTEVTAPPLESSVSDTLGLTDSISVTTTGLFAMLADTLPINDTGAPQVLDRTEIVADTISLSDTATPSGDAVVTPPVANAGPNQSVAPSTQVILDGSGSAATAPRVITDYDWLQLSGPAVTLSGTGATRTFIPTINGTYVFGLTVTDDRPMESTQDTVTITVSSGGTTKMYYSDGVEWYPL